MHYGLASTMLGQLPVGGCVPGIVRTLQSDFHLPDDKSALPLQGTGNTGKPQEIKRPGDEHQPSDESWEGISIFVCVCVSCIDAGDCFSQNLKHTCNCCLSNVSSASNATKIDMYIWSNYGDLTRPHPKR